MATIATCAFRVTVVRLLSTRRRIAAGAGGTRRHGGGGARRALQTGVRGGPSFAYSLPVHSFHTRRDRVASLTTCRLQGAPIQRASPLGPGRALTFPCGWNNAGGQRAPRAGAGGGRARKHSDGAHVRTTRARRARHRSPEHHVALPLAPGHCVRAAGLSRAHATRRVPCPPLPPCCFCCTGGAGAQDKFQSLGRRPLRRACPAAATSRPRQCSAAPTSHASLGRPASHGRGSGAPGELRAGVAPSVRAESALVRAGATSPPVHQRATDRDQGGRQAVRASHDDYRRGAFCAFALPRRQRQG